MLTLDSDDWLPDKAVDMIEEYMPIVRCDKKICGMIALKADANGKVLLLNLWITGCGP